MKIPLAAFGAALALLALSAAAAPPLLAGEATLTARFDVEIIGNGPDVVLIPGLNSTREVWRPTAEALASDHRVHLVQLAGFGRSEEHTSELQSLMRISYADFFLTKKRNQQNS